MLENDALVRGRLLQIDAGAWRGVPDAELRVLLENGLIETRVRVDVRAESHPGRLQKPDHVLFRKVPRAVEAHVLDEVCETSLIVVFENRSGVDDEPELGTPKRLLVGAQVIAKTVRQRSDDDSRIDRDLGGQRNVLRARTGGTLGSGGQAG